MKPKAAKCLKSDSVNPIIQRVPLDQTQNPRQNINPESGSGKDVRPTEETPLTPPSSSLTAQSPTWEDFSTLYENNMLYRFRVRMASDAAAWTDVPGIRLESVPVDANDHTEISSDRSILRVLGKQANGVYCSAPPANSYPSYREFDLFATHHAEVPSGSEYKLRLQATRLSGEGEGAAGLSIADCAVSRVNPDDLHWIKTIEWNFTESPYAAGWKRVDGEDDADHYIRPYYHTDLSKVSMHDENVPNQRRVHRLRIECKQSNGLRGGWHYENILRRPTQYNEYYSPQAAESYDMLNRLLMVKAVVSASVPGDQIPPLLFTIESNGFLNHYEISRLMVSAQEPLAANTPTVIKLYVAPQHGQCIQNGGGDASKSLRFAFEAVGAPQYGATQANVNLEWFEVYETILADMPSGCDYKTQQSPWPSISFPREQPDAGLFIHPYRKCGDSDTSGNFDINDHGTFYYDNRWHIYGILYPKQENSDDFKFKVPGRDNVTFKQGLGHVKSCFPNSGLDAIFGPVAGGYLADYKGVQFTDNGSQPPLTNDIFVEPGTSVSSIPAIWAPTIIQYGRDEDKDRYIMFYTQAFPNGTNKIGYLKSTDPDVPLSWEPVDGVRYLSPVQTGNRDFNLTKDIQGRYHAYWIDYDDEHGGGSGLALVRYKSSVNPTRFHEIPDGPIAFDLCNSDSGRPWADNESCFAVYDSSTSLFYLMVAKDGVLYPNSNKSLHFLALDGKTENSPSALIHIEAFGGDRSVLIQDADCGAYPDCASDPDCPPECKDSDLRLYDPITIILYYTSRYDNGRLLMDHEVLVLDKGNSEQNPAIIRICLGSGERSAWLSRQQGAPLDNPTDAIRVKYHEGKTYVLVLDQGGSIWCLDGGTQREVTDEVPMFRKSSRELEEKEMAGFKVVQQVVSRDANEDHCLLSGIPGLQCAALFEKGPHETTKRLYYSCINESRRVVMRLDISTEANLENPNNLPTPTELARFTENMDIRGIFVWETKIKINNVNVDHEYIFVLFSTGDLFRVVITATTELPVEISSSSPWMSGFDSPSGLDFAKDFTWFDENEQPKDQGRALLVSGSSSLTAVSIEEIMNDSKTEVLVEEKEIMTITSAERGRGYSFNSLGKARVFDINKHTPCESPHAGTKMYWSAHPDHFPAEHYMGWFSEVACELTCDTHQPDSITRWFLSYTDVIGEDRWGWGLREVKWIPPMATPVP